MWALHLALGARMQALSKSTANAVENCKNMHFKEKKPLFAMISIIM